MAIKTAKTPPIVHAAFDVKAIDAQAVEAKTAPHTIEPAVNVPGGMDYAGEYLAQRVVYRVDAAGRKIIVSPLNMAGTCMNP